MKHLLLASVLVFSTLQIHAAEPHLAHMVFFTLAEDTSANRETLVAACQKYLSDHEGTVYFSAGSINEELDREVNDKDFDVALHLVFESRKAHDTYQTHPRHLQFIDENKHLWSAVRVFDSNVASASHQAIPKGGQGFAGMLRGEVTHKKDGRITLRVTEIIKAWRHSEAKDAASLVGKSIVLAGREKAADIGKFIRGLKVGQRITIDVANQQENTMTILELTDDQRERLGR